MEKIKEIAVQEILYPTLDTTKQFLKILKVQTEHSIPIVKHIKVDKDNHDATVYFPVDGEEFFLAVYLDIENDIKVRAVETEAGSSVYLSVGYTSSLDIELPIIPDKTYKDCRIYGIDIDQPDNVEIKIEKLLAYIEPYKEIIKEISETNSVTINIAYYGYRDQMWGLHLDTRVMQKIVALNAELDFDIYAEGKGLY